MAAKTFFVVCAQAILIQMAYSQVVTSTPNIGSTFGTFGNILNSGNTLGTFGNILNSGNLASGFGGSVLGNTVSGSAATVTGLTGLNIVAGGPLVVTSISPIGPSGLAVASENALEGALAVSGQLPYLSAVAFEGAVPTSGSGTATCGCGSGSVGIVSEGFPANSGVGNRLY